MPEISVIVPVYKVEQYLRRCVDSILAQTFTNIEVILVDDGSPDSCPAICDEYAQQDNRVKVIHQENRGVSAARNAGLDWVFANSDSQWISFVDSDDWVHPQFLEYLHRAALENKVNVSICEYKVTEESNTIEKSKEYCSKSWSITDIYKDSVYKELLGVCWNKLYKTTAFKATRYPEELAYSEDAVFVNNFLSKLDNIAVVYGCFYYYYINTNSVTHQGYTSKEICGIIALQKQYQEFEKKQQYEIAKACCIKVLVKFSSYIDRCGSEPGQLKNQKFLRRELRKELSKTKRLYHLKCSDYEWIYEKAYPRRMALYWKWKRFRELLGQEGLGSILRRLKKRLFRP